MEGKALELLSGCKTSTSGAKGCLEGGREGWLHTMPKAQHLGNRWSTQRKASQGAGPSCSSPHCYPIVASLLFQDTALSYTKYCKGFPLRKKDHLCCRDLKWVNLSQAAGCRAGRSFLSQSSCAQDSLVEEVPRPWLVAAVG